MHFKIYATQISSQALNPEPSQNQNYNNHNQISKIQSFKNALNG
jgi:hypothetical protein